MRSKQSYTTTASLNAATLLKRVLKGVQRSIHRSKRRTTCSWRISLTSYNSLCLSQPLPPESPRHAAPRQHPQVEVPEVEALDAENPAARPSRGSAPESNDSCNSSSNTNCWLLLPRAGRFILLYSYARPEAVHDKIQAMTCSHSWPGLRVQASEALR